MSTEQSPSDVAKPIADGKPDPAVHKAAGRPQPGRNAHPGKPGFHNGKPMRRRIASSKAAVMSPEARRIAEERNQRMVDEFLQRNKITQCEPRYALGSYPMSLFGTEV